MNRPQWMAIGISAAVLFTGNVVIAAEGASNSTLSVPKGWKFSLPDGDPKTGKTVFMNMQCYSCHSIQIPGEKLAAREASALS